MIRSFLLIAHKTMGLPIGKINKVKIGIKKDRKFIGLLG